MNLHVLQHVRFEGLGSIERWLNKQKYRVTYTRFFESATLPRLDEVDLLIVLGGPMGVNDEDQLPWLRDEKRFLAEAIASGKSVLGICLGAQLIASALGARVRRARESEIGWFPIVGMPKIDGAFCFPDQTEVFHWHGDTFDLPDQAMHLAKSVACENQAFQVGSRVIGLQFHLEVTPESIDAMVNSCGEGLHPQRFVQTREQLRAVSSSNYVEVNALMERVLKYLTRQA
jgi:GMP synthase-like glutamine amidotransferase